MIDTRDQYQDLVAVYWAIGGAVLVLVWVALLYLAVRYRRRPGDESLPEDLHEKSTVESTYVGVLAAISALLVFFTFTTLSEYSADLPAQRAAAGQQEAAPPQVPAADVRIDVVASRWNWRFDYPALGITQVGSGTAIPTLVVPRGNVRFSVTSTDVIHSFFLPMLRFKRDAFPGRRNRFTLGFPDTGFFKAEGKCAEYCGLRHAYMGFNVRVLEPAEFRRWAQARQDGRPQERTPILDEDGRWSS